MSFFSGYSFFVYVFLLLLPAMVLGYLERPLRGYRRLLTAFFIWAVYRKSPGELLYLLAYAALSVYLVRFYLFFGRGTGGTGICTGMLCSLPWRRFWYARYRACTGKTGLPFWGFPTSCSGSSRL